MIKINLLFTFLSLYELQTVSLKVISPDYDFESKVVVSVPTPSPTFYVAPTTFLPVTCAAYSTSNSSYANHNYSTCTFTACAGVSLRIADCDATRCASGSNNDQFIRLYDGRGDLLASDDVSCNVCSDHLHHHWNLPSIHSIRRLLWVQCLQWDLQDYRCQNFNLSFCCPYL